jgi:hypothetical protein
MFERVSAILTHFSVRRPWLILSVFVALVAAGAWGSSKLVLKLNYMDLLPEDAPEVVDLRWVMKKAGTEGYLVTALSGGTREERLAFVPKLTRAIEEMPEIRYAEYQNDVAFFRKNAGALISLDEVRRIRRDLDAKVKQGLEDSMDLGLDDAPKKQPADDDAAVERAFAEFDAMVPSVLLENAEKSELYVLAKPSTNSLGVEEVRALLAHLDQVTKAEIAASGKPFRTEYGGPSVLMQAFNDGVSKDLGVISLVALITATLLLLLATRRPLASLLILLPIGGAITCSMGVAAFTIGHLNIISSLLVAVILGLGVEFGIHLVLRTNEARVHLSIEDALLEAVPETMEGAFSGAITNAASFFVLIFASFSAYRQFGIIAAVGILLSWLFSYTLLPALIVVFERLLPGWVIRANQKAQTRFHPPRWLLATVVVGLPLLAAFGAFALPRVGLERSFNALHGDHVPDPVGQRASDAMGTTLTPAVIWVASIDHARRLEAIFDELKQNDKNPNGSIIKTTMSLGRVLHDDWAERKPELDAIRKSLGRLPDSTWKKHEARLEEFREAVSGEQIRLANLPVSFTRKFTPLDDDGTFVLFLPSRSVDDARELDDFVDKLELAVSRAEAEGIRARVMSENRIAVHIFRQVFDDAPFIGWAATLVSLAVLFLLLRKVRETLIVFAPLALGMLMMVAGLYVLRIKLNFINMCVIPSIFTVAIDNTVHLYHRYAKEGKEAMPLILGNTGMAILMASLVNASGYAPMLLADFFGLRSLGIVATLGMAGMVLATVAWFPALLLLVPEAKVHPEGPASRHSSTATPAPPSPD